MTTIQSPSANTSVLCLVLLCTALWTVQSHAASVECSATMTDMDFGGVEWGPATLSAATTGTLTYQCTNNTPSVQYINACFSLDDITPTGAHSPAWFTLYNAAGNTLLFRLKNAATGAVWGPMTAQQSVSVTRALPGNTQSRGDIAIRGELFSPQKSVQAGQYQSRLNTDSTAITWSESPYGVPDTCLEQTAHQPLDFRVSARVEKTCDISAQDIDFGQVTAMDNRMLEAQGGVTVVCTLDTPYTLALRSVNMKGGQFYLLPVTGQGGEEANVAYSLYQNPARTLLWSDGNNQKTDQGTGGMQVHPVYGRILGGQIGPLRSGRYQDTVIVTVSF